MKTEELRTQFDKEIDGRSVSEAAYWHEYASWLEQKLLTASQGQKLSEQELKDLKLIRNYFGIRDTNPLEHMAYAVLDNLIKKFTPPTPTARMVNPLDGVAIEGLPCEPLFPTPPSPPRSEMDEVNSVGWKQEIELTKTTIIPTVQPADKGGEDESSYETKEFEILTRHLDPTRLAFEPLSENTYRRIIAAMKEYATRSVDWPERKTHSPHRDDYEKGHVNGWNECLEEMQKKNSPAVRGK